MKITMAKIITLFILGILNCLLFIVSVTVLILLQFHPPVNGSLRPSIWMCICVVITMVGMLATIHSMEKLNKSGNTK
jgi:hypothetical protein